MIKKVKRIISNKRLFSKDDHLLLAVSGGADSLCLFLILEELGYNIEIAHCNFNLREEEADNDENFVKQLAAEYEVKCHIKSFDTKGYAAINKLSIQMAARDLRYKWFDELLEVNNLDYVITGHHKDDNLETFFINLIRGTGIDGLCGMQVKNKKIIRPFLELSRQEIEEYLVERDMIWCNDSTNIDVKYLRNKIRHQLIPLLEEMNPNIKQRVTDEIFILDGIAKVFHQQVNVIADRLVIEKEGVYKINISELIKLDHLEIILFELLKPFGFSEVDKIIKAINSQSGKGFFSEDYQLIIDRKEIVISALEDDQNEIEILDMETQIETPICISFSTSFDALISKDLNIAKLDFDKISFPLRLRKWRNGDRFKPLGMRNFKKLSDFFIDEKYSILDKQRQWLLCSEDDIIWIVGKRIDDRYKIEDHTKKVYIAELLKER